MGITQLWLKTKGGFNGIEKECNGKWIDNRGYKIESKHEKINQYFMNVV